MRSDVLTDPTDRLVTTLLRRQAEDIGDVEFLVESGRSLSYALADDLADRHAGAYAGLGVGKGDTVAFLLNNSTDVAVTSFGVNRLGAIWSPVSPEYRGEWLGELLTDVHSDVLVVDAELWPAVAALPGTPFRHLVVRGGPDALTEPVPAGIAVHDFASFDQHDRFTGTVERHYGDTNAILWTSGTTGRSKGVMQSDNVWFTVCGRMNEVWRDGVREGERFYCDLPMYNSGGWLMNIYPALLSGTTACMAKRFSASEYWDRVRAFDANHGIVLGTMQLYLWQQEQRPDDADNPMRTMVLMPVIEPIMRPFMERFGIERVNSGFGQSEVMGTTLYKSDWPLAVGSCGYTRDDDPVETRLLDEDDREVGVEEVGEFCVRPRTPFSIFNGYFRDPERTAEASRNMWHHTGDLGRRNERGELFFVDRKKDSLRHKGRNTSTFEVEHIARRFPGVVDVAAVGVAVPGMQFEEELMVLLKPATGVVLDPLEFCKHMDAHAPYFFVPRWVDVVEEFPVTPTGKIQKFKLREKGLTPTAWDRTVEAPDWQPTR